MTLKNYKPTTPSLRHRIIVKKPKKIKNNLNNKQLKTNASLLNEEILSKKIKFLSTGWSSWGGRNNQGRITVRHRGGKSKAKRKLRIIDWARDLGKYSKCEVINIEYNPFTSGWIACLKPINLTSVSDFYNSSLKLQSVNKKHEISVPAKNKSLNINLLSKEKKLQENNIKNWQLPKASNYSNNRVILPYKNDHGGAADYWANKIISNINKTKYFYILAPSHLKKGDIITGLNYLSLKKLKKSDLFTSYETNLASRLRSHLKKGEENQEQYTLHEGDHIGNSKQIKDIPIGTYIYNVQTKENSNNSTLWEYNEAILNKSSVLKENKAKFSQKHTFDNYQRNWAYPQQDNKQISYNKKISFELDFFKQIYKFTNLYKKVLQSQSLSRIAKPSRNGQKVNYHGKIARSAGTFCIVLKTLQKTSDDSSFSAQSRSIIRLPSKQLLSLSSNCLASIGRVSNEDHFLTVKGKAGANRWLARRPCVRGEAQNPVDHPHGGKSHGSGGLGNPPKTKFGKLAKWQAKKKK